MTIPWKPIFNKEILTISIKSVDNHAYAWYYMYIENNNTINQTEESKMTTNREWLEIIEECEKEIREAAETAVKENDLTEKWAMIEITPAGLVEVSFHDDSMVEADGFNKLIAVFQDMADFECELSDAKAALGDE